MEKSVILGGVLPGSNDGAGSLGEFWDHIDSSDFLGTDQASTSVRDSVEFFVVSGGGVGESDIPVKIQKEIENGEEDFADDSDHGLWEVIVLLKRIEHGCSHIGVHTILILLNFWSHQLSLSVSHLVGISSESHDIDVVSLILDDILLSIGNLFQ